MCTYLYKFIKIKPNFHNRVTLKKQNESQITNYTIPENFSQKNQYIQLKSENQAVYHNYFNSSLKYQLLENYGQIKVMDAKNNPLPKIYVKVFA